MRALWTPDHTMRESARISRREFFRRGKLTPQRINAAKRTAADGFSRRPKRNVFSCAQQRCRRNLPKAHGCGRPCVNDSAKPEKSGHSRWFSTNRLDCRKDAESSICRSPNFQSHPAACTMERGDFAAKNSIFQSKIVSVRSLRSEILEISVKTGACSGNAEPPLVFQISSKAQLPAAQFEDFRRVTRQRARRPVYQLENALGFFTESFSVARPQRQQTTWHRHERLSKNLWKAREGRNPSRIFNHTQQRVRVGRDDLRGGKSPFQN